MIASTTGNVTLPMSGTGVTGAPKLTRHPDRPRLRHRRGRSGRHEDVRHLQRRQPAAHPQQGGSSSVAVPRGRPRLRGPAALPRRHLPPVGDVHADPDRRLQRRPTSITGNDGSGSTAVTVHGTGIARSGTPVLGPGNKCLDVRSSGTADGTPVQLYTCNGTDAQQLDADRPTGRSGRSASASTSPAAGPSTAPGSSCGPVTAPARRSWAGQADGSMWNPQSGRCLDVPGGNATDGAGLQIYDVQPDAGATLAADPRYPPADPAG